MKTDSIWYRLFKSLPGVFFELIEQPPAIAHAYEFSAVEVKQTAFRIDGVFLPTLNYPDQPLYFSEFQFQSDPKLYSRFFSEIFLYLDKTERLNDWRGVVVWANRNLDTGSRTRYAEFFDQRVQCIYLDELQPPESSIGLSLIKLVVEPQAQAGEAAKKLIETAKSQPIEQALQREVLELIETIVIYKFPQLDREAIERMLGLSELKQTAIYQEAKLEGRLEGRLEGKLEGKLETIPRLVQIGLTVEQIAKALELDIELVRKMV